MAINFGQGAPGVDIRLRDRSEQNLVLNPNIVGGVVGHASRGEFNTIIDLTSLSDVDVILGSGFNNPKYNQGLYAARSIIGAGGFVEFVRPYGEEIITDDNDDDYETNQALKTDTFLVSYDYSGTASTDSIDIEHFAATRHIEDGFTTLGEREIHTIQKTITENTNVNFLLDSPKVADAGSGTKKIPVFAIMNSDPTSSKRAGDSVEISSITSSGTELTVTTEENHGFKAGDEIVIGGTVNYNGTFVVDDTIPITDTTFTVLSALTEAAESTGSAFINEDDVNSGVDALQIRTVTSGNTTKNFEFLDFKEVTDEDIIEVQNSNGQTTIFEFDNDSTLTDDDNWSVSIEFDEFSSTNVDDSGDTIATDNGQFEVGDIVRFVLGTGGAPVLPAPLAAATDYVVASNTDGVLSFVTDAGVAVDITDTGTDGTTTNHQIVNVTRTAKNFIDALVSAGFTNNTRAIFKGNGVDATTDEITVDNAALFTVGDEIILSLTTNETNGVDVALPTGMSDSTIYTVSSVSLADSKIKLTGLDITAAGTEDDFFRITNLTTAKGSSVALSSGHRVDFVGVKGLTIPDSGKTDAVANSFFTITLSAGDITKGTVGGTTIYVIETSEDDIVLDSGAGVTFMNLGLANEDYIDIDFDGVANKVYKLTTEGADAAKIYLFVDYFFNGTTFSFSGTIIPFVAGDTNLYISENAAFRELGWDFVINENVDLEGAISETGFDFSQTVDENDLISSNFSGVAFNSEDPAILNDAVWEYDPSKNNTTAILSAVWELFLDKDRSGTDMLVSAGTAISNLFIRGFEQINYSVMTAMLTICEKRKDMFCVFDGVDEKNIDVALEKMVGIGNQGEIGRWGGIFDGRSIFADTAYTKISVEAVKSIEVATIITLNRSGNAFWLPPAGYETGRIPAANASRQKFERSYKFRGDPTSDIARLYDASINPTRVNGQGQVIYGQKTMLRRSTALNRMNVIMLIAGIHRRFGNYLELKVFKLNTPQLRAQIVADLQPQLDAIGVGVNAGLTTGVVFCNADNNPQPIIDTEQLIVDVVIQPTRSTEFITLRTTVQRTGEDVNLVDITIIGG